jgi:hypothetical protein
LTTPALSQDNAEKPSAPVDEGQGIAEQAPAPQDDGGQGANDPQAPAAQPLSASTPVENQTAPEPSCGPRCQAAENREKADLVAQQSMAVSTNKIVGLTEWQLYVGGLGLFLLIVTLWLTRRATNAAIEANRIARESAEQQLRAYVLINAVNFSADKNKKTLRASFTISNTGQTPAYHVHNIINIGGDYITSIPDHPNKISMIDLGSGGQMFSSVVSEEMSEDKWNAIGSRDQKIYVWGIIRYKDIFSRDRETAYRLILHDIDNLWTPTKDGNYAT